jgi:hypothetical protein
MKQIIINLAQIACVGAVASVVCLVASLILSEMISGTFASEEEKSNTALEISCCFFAVALCLWLYG